MTNNPQIEEKSSNIICKIGVSRANTGYQYLLTGISMAVVDDRLLNSLSKKFYPTVAEIHDVSVDKVQRSIRNAIVSGWKRRDSEYADSVFGRFGYGEFNPPPPSVVIATFVDRIKLGWK